VPGSGQARSGSRADGAAEALTLTWRDVDFAGRRFIVRASKTKHHADGAIRVVGMSAELADRFPSQVCAAWLGLSEAVADAFYRQLTDAHFAQALQPAHSAAQKAAQYGAESSRTEQKYTAPQSENRPEISE